MSEASTDLPRVVVVGAGGVGTYVGGRLSLGARVTLVGRADPMRAVRQHGLTLGSGESRTVLTVDDDRLSLDTRVEAVADADVVLLTVKCRDTASATELMRPHLRAGVPVVNIQNGVRNTSLIASLLRDAHPVVPGVVGYNIVKQPGAAYLKASAGIIYLGAHPAVEPLHAAMTRARLAHHLRDDIVAVQYGKLLLNLNNAVHALSGRSLGDELCDRGHREVLARAIFEALDVFDAAGIDVARLVPVAHRRVVGVLRGPDAMVRAAIRTIMGVRPEATSSMADDLARGQATEIGELQGLVCELGQAHGIPTPVNATLLALVRDAERVGPDDLPRFSGASLLAAVESSPH